MADLLPGQPDKGVHREMGPDTGANIPPPRYHAIPLERFGHPEVRLDRLQVPHNVNVPLREAPPYVAPARPLADLPFPTVTRSGRATAPPVRYRS